MKKFFSISFLLICVLATSVSAKEVKKSEQSIMLDGKEVNLSGFNIDGSNYFRLRDVAAILSNTDVGFNVNYNENRKLINITKYEKYTPIKGDLENLSADVVNAKKSNSKVLVDGERIVYDSYNILGNNYFKLRDLGKTLGFYVDYNEKENSIILKNQKTIARTFVDSKKVKITNIASNLSDNTITLNSFNTTINQLCEKIKYVVVLTHEGKQDSAKVFYDEDNNKLLVEPISLKYSYSVSLNPVIKISKDEDTFIEVKENSIDLKEYIDEKNISNYKIYLGYYDDNSKNFRALCEINLNQMGIDNHKEEK